jgi:hypothetical protein
MTPIASAELSATAAVASGIGRVAFESSPARIDFCLAARRSDPLGSFFFFRHFRPFDQVGDHSRRSLGKRAQHESLAHR